MKKLISFILSLSLVLASTTLSYAQDKAEDVNALSNLISDLGINKDISGNENGEITRAELVAMIVRAMNVDSKGYTYEQFDDIADSAFKNEIAAAKKLGITNGTSETKFSPDMPVGPAVAAKMMLSALSYNSKAEAIGGYPFGYIKLAMDLDLFDGIDDGASALSVDAANILIYNMLLADKAVFSSMKDDSLIYSEISGVNLLTENFKLKKYSGIVHTVASRGVEYEKCTENELLIDNMSLIVQKDYSHILGLKVDVWYDEQNVVKAVDIKDNSTVSFDADKVVDYKNKEIIIDDDNKQKSYRIDDGYSFILNGRACSATKDDYKFKTGSFTLVDNDNDGKYEYVLAKKLEYFVIRSINTGDNEIYDSNSALKYISLDESDSDYIFELSLNGAKADIGDLAVNMVCSVAKSRDGGLCVIEASDLSLTAAVTAFDDEYVFLGNDSYKLSEYWTNKGVSIRAGSEYSFLVSPSGELIDIGVVSSDKMLYAYLIGYQEKGGMGYDTQIKLLDENGSIKIYTLKNKLVSDGSSKTLDQIKPLLKNGEYPRYGLVRYMAKDGFITHIDFSDTRLSDWQLGTAKDELNSLTKYAEAASGFTVTVEHRTGYGIPGVPFRSVKSIFQVPKNLYASPNNYYDTELFRVITSSELERVGSETTYEVDVYDYNEFYVPGAVVVYNSTADVRGGFIHPADSGTGYMVHKLTDIVDENGIKRKKLSVFDGNKYQYLLFEENTEQFIKDSYAFPNPGDIIRLILNSKNEIIGMRIDVSYNKATGLTNVNYSAPAGFETRWTLGLKANSAVTYFAGRAKNHDSSYMTIIPDGANVPPDRTGIIDGVVNLDISTATAVIVFDRKSGESYSGTLGEIVTEFNAGAIKASYVVCKSYYYQIKTIYIYVN